MTTEQERADPFADLGPEVGADPWDPPLPLEQVILPPFPRGALPLWLERYADGLATELQVPRELCALLALAVCAGACSQRAQIRVRARFVQPLNIWVLVPLPSGHRKSAAVQAVTEPVRQWQKEQAEAMRESVAEGASRARMAQLALKGAEAAAARASDHTERLRAEADALELARAASALRVPHPPRLLAHDITAERLASLMAEHDERMAIIAPEGTIFELMSGRYSAGIPNIDIYKAAHAGDMFAVDREADRQGRPPIILERPALTLGISPQPDVVRKLTDKEQFRAEGLLARFLYSLPQSMLGARDNEPPPLADEVRRAYEDGVRALLALPVERDAEGKGSPQVLTCTPGARRALLDFERELEPQLGEEGDLEAIADWSSKLAGQTARLAGVLHLAAGAQPGHDAGARLVAPVEEQTMRAALRLARYFIPHAQAAFAQMGVDTQVRRDAKHLLAWIGRWTGRKDEPGSRAARSFSRHDCWHNNRSARFRRAQDVDAPLALLCEHGYIRPRGPARTQTPKGGRPPSQIYDVHPEVGAQNPQNPQNGDNAEPAGAHAQGFGGFGGFGGQGVPSANGHRMPQEGRAAVLLTDEDDDSIEV